MIIIESLQRGQKRKGMQLNKTKMVVVVDVEEECGCGGSFEDCGACGRRVGGDCCGKQRVLRAPRVVSDDGGGDGSVLLLLVVVAVAVAVRRVELGLAPLLLLL